MGQRIPITREKGWGGGGGGGGVDEIHLRKKDGECIGLPIEVTKRLEQEGRKSSKMRRKQKKGKRLEPADN